MHLRTQKGSTLEAWYGAGYSTSIVLVRDAEHPRVIGSVPDGGVALAPLILLQQPSGTLLVYFTAVTGTFRLSSSDDGRTWTMPVRTALSADARIEGGAVRRSSPHAAPSTPNTTSTRSRHLFTATGRDRDAGRARSSLAETADRFPHRRPAGKPGRRVRAGGNASASRTCEPRRRGPRAASMR